jgi:hypothetical protein
MVSKDYSILFYSILFDVLCSYYEYIFLLTYNEDMCDEILYCTMYETVNRYVSKYTVLLFTQAADERQAGKTFRRQVDVYGRSSKPSVTKTKVKTG